MRECNLCHQILPLESFNRRKASKDGFAYTCRLCSKEYCKKNYRDNHTVRRKQANEYRIKNLDKVKEYQREYRKRTRGKRKRPIEQYASEEKYYRMRFRARLRKVGWSHEHYKEQIYLTKGLCAICGNEGKCLDHNHNTKVARSILCNNCNAALGMVKEDKNILLSLIKYIDKWN